MAIPKGRVLACAPSNRAVIELLDRFRALGRRRAVLVGVGRAQSVARFAGGGVRAAAGAGDHRGRRLGRRRRQQPVEDRGVARRAMAWRAAAVGAGRGRAGADTLVSERRAGHGDLRYVRIALARGGSGSTKGSGRALQCGIRHRRYVLVLEALARNDGPSPPAWRAPCVEAAFVLAKQREDAQAAVTLGED